MFDSSMKLISINQKFRGSRRSEWVTGNDLTRALLLPIHLLMCPFVFSCRVEFIVLVIKCCTTFWFPNIDVWLSAVIKKCASWDQIACLFIAVHFCVSAQPNWSPVVDIAQIGVIAGTVVLFATVGVLAAALYKNRYQRTVIVSVLKVSRS